MLSFDIIYISSIDIMVVTSKEWASFLFESLIAEESKNIFVIML